MRDNPRITLHYLSPRDQRLFDAACEWAQSKVSTLVDRLVPNISTFSYEDTSLVDKHTRAFYWKGEIAVSKAVTEELMTTRDRDTLKRRLRMGVLPEAIYPFDDAIFMLGTLAHEYAHALFRKGLYHPVLARLRSPGMTENQLIPSINAIDEVFAYAVQQKITGLVSFGENNLNGYFRKLDFQVLISYSGHMGNIQDGRLVDVALLDLVETLGPKPDEDFKFPSGKEKTEENAMRIARTLH